jgi:hypothetical protein
MGVLMPPRQQDILRPIAEATAEAVRAAAAGATAAVESTRIAAQATTAAATALSKIDAHQAVCIVKEEATAAQIAQLLGNQTAAAAERTTMHTANQESIRRIYALLWKLVIGTGAAVIVQLIAWCAALLWYVITNHP